jgi:hypothetical protein
MAGILLSFDMESTALSVESESINIARGKAYTLSRTAGYKHTSDEGDRVQLTDGKLTAGGMWLSRDALGWTGYEPIHIEIQLGKAYRVGRVRIHTCTNKEVGIKYPTGFYVFSTDNKVSYKYIGAWIPTLTREEQPQKYQHSWFEINDLSVDTRYVRVVLIPGSNYVYLDEVEIYPAGGGEDRPHAGVMVGQLNKFVQILRERQGDLEILHREALKRTQSTQASEEKNTWEGLLTRILNYPINQLDVKTLWEDALSLHSKSLKHLDFPNDLIVWPAEPYDKVNTPFLVPEVPPRWGRRIELTLLQGEWSNSAFWITNISPRTQTVRLTVGPYPSAKVEIRRATEVRSINGSRVLDALDPMPLDGQIRLRAGESVQLWVSVHPRSDATGLFEMPVRIFSDDKFISDLTIGWEVLPIALNENVNFYGNVWAYPTLASMRGIYQYVAEDLNRHGINVFVVNPSTIKPPRKDRNLLDNFVWETRELSEFAQFVVKRDGYLLLYLDFGSESSRNFFSDIKWMSNGWQSLATKWLLDIKSALSGAGLNADRWAFYPVDEISSDASATRFIEFANFALRVDRSFRFYVNPRGKISLSTLERIAPYVDIWQPKAYVLDDPAKRFFFKRVRGLKWLSEFLVMSQGDKERAPLDYALQPWLAFHYGFEGGGFWAYMHTGWGNYPGSARTDLDGKGPDYAVVYESGSGLAPSRRWEAWACGVQDFAVLSKARHILGQLRDKKVANFREMDKELKALVERMVTNPNAKQSSTYVQAREDIRRITAKLASLMKSIQ